MRRVFLCMVVLAAACGEEKEELPPPNLPVIRVDLPSGAALKPFDPARPTKARPQGLAAAPSGKLYATLANLRTYTPCAWSECWEPGGPGMLAEVDPAAATASLIDLGNECQNPQQLVIRGGTAYVSCTGDYFSNGALATVDLGSRQVRHVTVGGGPWAIEAGSDGTVYMGNTGFGGSVDCGNDGTTEYLTPGTLDVVGPDGQVTAATGKVVCPASCDAQWNGVGDLRIIGGDLYAACLGSDELVRLGFPDLNERSRVHVGDGPQALAPGLSGTVLVANSIGATLSVVTPHPDGSLTADKDRVALGEVPNDVEVQGTFAYVVNSGTATVQKIDLATMTKKDARTTLDKSNPWSLAFESEGVVWVTAYELGALLKLDFNR